MKTHTIKTPTAELLIVEHPQSWGLKVGEEALLIYDHTKKAFGKTYTFNGSYTLLGKPAEIREEDAKEIVQQSIHTGLFAHYVKGIPVNTYCYKTATESLLSLLESVIFWDVNPYRDVSKNFYDFSIKSQKEKYNKDYHNFWNAKSKTFDRSRTLIFVKQ